MRQADYAKKNDLWLSIHIAWAGLFISLLIGQVGYSTLTLAAPLGFLLIPFKLIKNTWRIQE